VGNRIYAANRTNIDSHQIALPDSKKREFWCYIYLYAIMYFFIPFLIFHFFLLAMLNVVTPKSKEFDYKNTTFQWIFYAKAVFFFTPKI